MTENQRSKCQYIIHSAATAAGAIGLSPIPGSDIGPIMAVQAGMILGLAKVFGITLTDAAAAQVAKTFVVGNLGKMIASELTKLLPFIGSAVCGTVAVALTEALGWETAREFAAKVQQKTS